MRSAILFLTMFLYLVSSSKDWREKDVLEYTDKDFDLLGKKLKKQSLFQELFSLAVDNAQ